MKFKLDKEISKRIAALSMAGIILISASGCSNKKNNTEDTNSTTSVVSLEESLVDLLDNKIATLFPQVNQEIVKNSSIILLLDQIAKEDANGKINVEGISKLKTKLDVDNMINEFNAFLDTLEFTMIDEKKVVKVSEILPEELKEDKEILSYIEHITSNIIDLVNNNGSKEDIRKEFNKIYCLFVKEEAIIVDEVKFETRDLCYSLRAVSQVYARVAAYFSRNYITQEEYDEIDDRTNDQNNKAYIKTKLEILSNQMLEISEIDVINIFNTKYNSIKEYTDGKVILNDGQIRNLVNYLNLKYLDSDKVATSDKNTVVGEYSDEKINETLETIDAIFEYNLKNGNDLILYSNLLIENYKDTSLGKIDKTALDFTLINCIRLLNTYNENSTIYNNPYFENISKYFTKQNFTQEYGNGESIEIVWQDISDSTNFVCNEVICYTLSKMQNVKNIDNYLKLSQDNLNQSIQYVQNTISGECKKVDTEFVKIK